MKRPLKIQNRFTYSEGPMLFIGQQLIKAMQQIGWDCKIFEHIRTPEKQAEYMARGVTKAGPWQSAHQYGLAVDIIHRTKAWNVPQRFWDDLNACVKVIERKFDVELAHGYDWGWDSAHVELKDFRRWRSAYHGRPLAPREHALIFEKVLPKVWEQHTKTKAYQKRQK